MIPLPAASLRGGSSPRLAPYPAVNWLPPRPPPKDAVVLHRIDEPTTGVDPVSRREFWQVLAELHHGGLTIVVSTPYMDEAEYATRIGFLDRGRLLAVGTRDEILAAYPRPLLEVLSSDRVAVRTRLAPLATVDDISLFGTRLHVRGAAGVGPGLLEEVRRALDGLVPGEGVKPIPPSLEDVFVLEGVDEEEAA